MESDAINFRRRMMTGGVDCDGAKANQSAALDRIHGYYKKALHRLPPKLIPSLLEAGFCFGFLDPVSNIIANTVSHYLDKGRETKKRSRAGNEKKGESRRTVISKIITESSKSICLVPRASDSSDTLLRNSSIAARSLRGLVTFLTSYFRYLTTWDALHYLSLSNADLLVAVLLIQEVRDPHTFTIQDDTAKIALACAAISALHPAVATLVSWSFLLASHVDEASKLLETQSRIGDSTIETLSELLTPTRDMANGGSPMQHAITRLQCRKMKGITRLQQRNMEFTVGIGLQTSLEMVLLDKLHLLYLQAISCISKDELCSRHHRGLLKAGYCFGPCDPVTNIILNTIWYDTMFPPKQHFEVEMICSKSLARIEFLSLCGLVAYICVRFPAFSVYEAMRRLLICNVRLDSVVEMATEEGHDAFSDSVACEAASRAAHHPSPSRLVEFVMTVMPKVGRTLGSVRWVLSSSDVRTISELLSQNCAPSKSLKVRKLSSRANWIISAHRDEFKASQGTIVKMVEAALHRYAKQSGQKYELLFICDVNSTISKDGLCYCSHSSSYSFSHMNIWARRRGSQNEDSKQVPTLFFIQCSNSDKDAQDMEFLCCPIFDPSKHAGRCYHCEYDGIKIIHPSSKLYLGRCTEFEGMARGRSAVDVQQLAEAGQTNTLFDGTLEYEDSIYFDPVWDADFSRFIDKTARDQAKQEKLRNVVSSKRKLRKEQHPESVGYSWIEKLVYKESLAWSAELA